MHLKKGPFIDCKMSLPFGFSTEDGSPHILITDLLSCFHCLVSSMTVNYISLGVVEHLSGTKDDIYGQECDILSLYMECRYAQAHAEAALYPLCLVQLLFFFLKAKAA